MLHYRKLGASVCPCFQLIWIDRDSFSVILLCRSHVHTMYDTEPDSMVKDCFAVW
jgi:hypothetical protein